jgi:hypothetical protein
VLATLDEALRDDPALLEPGERERIVERMAGLRTAAAGDDAYVLQAWLSSLDEAAKAFAERRASAKLSTLVAGRRVQDV